MIEPLYGIKNEFMLHLNYENILNELTKLLKNFPRKSKILIVNGNQGFIALTLAKLGHQVTILEPYNIELIQSLRDHWKLEELIEVIKWNEPEIKLDLDDKFDLVICAESYLYLNYNFGVDKTNQFMNKIKDKFNYILFIELNRDSAKWWSPFVLDYKFLRTFLKVYPNILINNRINPMNMFLISRTNPRNLKIFDLEPMTIVEKNYPHDGRNNQTEIYQSNTGIHKKIQKTFNQAYLEKSNIDIIGSRIRRELRLPEFWESQSVSGESFLSRKKFMGNTIYDQVEPNPISVEMFLSLMLNYSRRGYFHNDLRPWNVIANENQVELIDFEGLGRKDQDPSGYPQWIPMLAICNYLLQDGIREWKLDAFLDSVTKLIDFRQPVSQIYYEETWYLLHKNKNKILKLNFLNVENAINGFLEIINPNFTQIQKYWSIKQNEGN
jgi:hypothetical protein